MATPHYVRFVQALVLVAPLGGVSACTTSTQGDAGIGACVCPNYCGMVDVSPECQTTYPPGRLCGLGACAVPGPLPPPSLAV